MAASDLPPPSPRSRRHQRWPRSGSVTAAATTLGLVAALANGLAALAAPSPADLSGGSRRSAEAGTAGGPLIPRQTPRVARQPRAAAPQPSERPDRLMPPDPRAPQPRLAALDRWTPSPSLALPDGLAQAQGPAAAIARPNGLDPATAFSTAAAVTPSQAVTPATAFAQSPTIAQAAVGPTPAAGPPTAPASSSPGTEAQPPAMADWPSLDQMLGLPDWLSLQLSLTAAPIANPIGGLQPAANWMQLLELDASLGSGLGVSPQRWREIDHWQADLRFDLYSGSNGFGATIGSIIPPQTIEYPVGLWFSRASLTRRSRDDSLRLSAGLMSLDEDFVVAPAYNAYLFASINNTLNLNILGVPISPLMAPGGSLRWQTGRFGEWRLGAYWLDPEVQLASLFGVNTTLPTLTGNLQIIQWIYETPGDKARYSAPLTLPGGATVARQLPPPLLHLGSFRSSVNVGSTNNFLFPQALPAPGSTALNRVAYGSITLPLQLPLGLDNRLWGAVQLGFDPSVNPTPLFMAGGWLCQGPVRGRPLDVLALGLARTDLSAPLLPFLSWQAVVELNYSFNLNANLSLQPVLQWILNPAANGSVPGILTASLQLTLSF